MPQPVISFTNNNFLTGAFTGYQWNLNGIPIPGATTASYTPTGAPGSYTVNVWDTNGCSNTSAPYTTGTGVINIGRNNDIIVYPNPAHDVLQVSTKQDITFSLLKITGEVVFSSSSARSIDITQLPSGIYILKINGTDGTVIHIERVIKK